MFAGELATKLVSLLESFKALVQPSVYSLNNAKAWFADAADRRFCHFQLKCEILNFSAFCTKIFKEILVQIEIF